MFRYDVTFFRETTIETDFIALKACVVAESPNNAAIVTWNQYGKRQDVCEISVERPGVLQDSDVEDTIDIYLLEEERVGSALFPFRRAGYGFEILAFE